MNKSICKSLLAGMFVLALGGTWQGARAEDTAAPSAGQCTLRQYASLPITTLSDGQLAVPVNIAGQDQLFIVSLSDPYTHIASSFADSAGFKTTKLPVDYEMSEKGKRSGLSVIPEMKMGMAAGTNISMIRWEGDVTKPAVGDLGVDILSNYDVELDFKANRMNLFSQDHCAGKVVYWAASYVELPFLTHVGPWATELDYGMPYLNMELDGKEMSVSLHLNDAAILMSSFVAQKYFGIEKDSPQLTPSSDGSKSRYPFKELTLGGLSILHPEAYIFPAQSDCRVPNWQARTPGDYFDWSEMHVCVGVTDVTIGLAELRKLHLYIAFKERKFYVTSADAHQ